MPISQTGNKRQGQAADNFSSSWKLVSCLTVLGAVSVLNSDHASAHQGPQVSGVVISLTKHFLPAQREEVGLGAEQPCPRGGQTSENSQEVPLLALCELCPQLRAQAGV